MKITIENTSQIIKVNGLPCRIWEGETETGIKVHCVITRIAVHKDDDTEMFEKELQQVKAPSAETLSIFPANMII